MGIPKKPIWADLQTLFLCANWSFSVFCQGEFRKQPKFHILLFWLGKMHWNGLSDMYLGFKACWFQCCRFQVSAISSSWKITISGNNFTFCGFLTGKNASKLLEWCIFRIWGMPNPMALVASLYDKWFMKNHNFRRHITENGVQNHEHGMGHMQKSSLGPILPLHHVSESYI